MEEYSLMPSQKVLQFDEMYFGSNMKPRMNTLGVYVYVERDFSPEAMEKAFWRLVEMNDSLRLKFYKKGFKQRQYIKPFEPKPVRRIVLTDGTTFFDELKKYPKEIMLLFDDELCTADIIIDGEGTGGIIVTMHHSTADGYSYDLMISKLKAYYKAYAAGEEPAQEKVYSITDCFAATEKYLASKTHKKDRQWWIKTIAKQKNYCVPAKFSNKSMDCKKASFTIDGEMREQLLALCKKTNVSLNSCLLTIAALTTVRLTGKTNFSTYNMSHGRMTAAQKKTIGCMMYTVPVFYDVPVDDTVVSDFITEKYKDYLASITHARIPYGELVAAMYFKSLKARTFMHEWICLSQMDYRSEGEENDGFKSDAMPHYGLECPIYIGILEGSEDIVLDIAYQSEVFTPEQIEELWQAYRSVLCAVAGEPDASVRSIIARR